MLETSASSNVPLQVYGTVAGGYVRQGLTNLSSANDATAENLLSTGLANSYVVYGLSNRSAAPQASIFLGSAVTQGLLITNNSTNNALFNPNGGTAFGSYAAVNAPPANGLIIPGNVGIGTTTPGYALHVANAANTTIQVQATTSTVRGGLSSDTPVSGAFYSGSYSNHPFALGINNAERMRIDASGNIGIGTTTPNASSLLDISSTTKGFLPPRMLTTEVNAIATPADGLIVYDTDTDTLKLRANGAWVSLSTGSFAIGNRLWGDHTFGVDYFWIGLNGTGLDGSRVAIGVEGDDATTGTVRGVHFRTNDVLRMSIDGAGNVGIGVVPTKLFHVAANVADHSSIIGNSHASGYGLIVSAAFDPLRVGSNGNTTGDLFIVKGDANVGIGTTAPDSNLTVSSTGSSPGIKLVADGDGNPKLTIARVNASSDTNQQWAFDLTNSGGLSLVNSTSGATYMSLLPGSGMGLTWYASNLGLSGGGFRPASNDTGALGTSTIGWSDLYLASGGVLNWASGDVAIVHATNKLSLSGAENGYVFSDGNVGIGTTSPGDLLDVVGTNSRMYFSKAFPILSLVNDGNVTAQNPYIAWFDGATRQAYMGWGTPGTQFHIWMENGNQLAINNTWGAVFTNDDVRKPSGGVFVASSDARLKDIGDPYTTGLDALMKLNPVNYRYKKDNPRKEPSDKSFIGLIAQDVKKVFPRAVRQERDGYLSLDSSEFTYTLINAVKELKAENDDLRARLERLEAAQ